MGRTVFSLSLLVALSVGCIEKTGSSVDPGDTVTDAANNGGSSGALDGTISTDGGQAETDAAIPPPPPLADAGQTPDPSRPDSGEMRPEPPPPPPSDDACDRFCSRMDMCLFPACEGLDDIVPSGFCRQWCEDTPDEFLNETADLTCEGFVERLYSISDELGEFCSNDEPIPNECDEICEFAAQCGFPSDGCARLCRSLPQEQRNCMQRAEQCDEFFECIEDDGDRRGPDPEELCGNFCQRRSVCIFNGCAPGTLPDGYTRACFDDCIDNPPAGREIQEFFNQTCEEIIAGVRAEDAQIDERCEASAEDSCATVCRDRVVQCMGIEQADCEAQCENWDEANHTCIVRADSCREVNECFGDPEGQARCRRSCDVLQTCMEEACPPRILPPTLTDGCTAGCLDDPISEDDLEEWENLSCREVREVIYRGNRELRPLCEGGRDFRPTPEECVGFCDNALGQCLGVGGRNFCLAGCASLTREEYSCALEAQGDCQRINECLNGDAE